MLGKKNLKTPKTPRTAHSLNTCIFCSTHINLAVAEKDSFAWLTADLFKSIECARRIGFCRNTVNTTDNTVKIILSENMLHHSNGGNIRFISNHAEFNAHTFKNVKLFLNAVISMGVV